jgi:hypothetical protein
VSHVLHVVHAVSSLFVILSSMRKTHTIKSSLLEGHVSNMFVYIMFCLWSNTPHGLDMGNVYCLCVLFVNVIVRFLCVSCILSMCNVYRLCACSLNVHVCMQVEVFSVMALISACACCCKFSLCKALLTICYVY